MEDSAQRASELAQRLAFAAARLKSDTDPPSLGGFPEGTPTVRRLTPARPVDALGRALRDARGDLGRARAQIDELEGRLDELRGLPDEPPPRAA